MLTLGDLLYGVALPAALAAGVLLASWRAMRGRASARDSRSWAAPLAIGAGFVGGWLALFGRPEFPPLDATDWLFFAAPALVALALCDAYLGIPPQGRYASWFVAIPPTCWVLARPLAAAGDEQIGIVAVASMIAALAWIFLIDALASRVSAARLSGLLLAAVVPASVVLILSGSQRLAQIGMLLAATQAGALVANLIMGPAGVGRGVSLVFGALYGGLLFCGQHYAELSPVDAAILYAAPLAAWIVQRLSVRFEPRSAGALECWLVLAAASVAVADAWMRFEAARLE